MNIIKTLKENTMSKTTYGSIATTYRHPTHDKNELIAEMLKTLEIMVQAANQKEIDPLVMFASIERARAVIKKARGGQ